MAAKYKKLISDYCAARGITIPPGFGRNTPNHFAVIRMDIAPPKLVATTWLKVSDVLDYIENQLMAELGERTASSIQILDFKVNEVLAYAGTKRLERVGTLQTQ